MLNSLKKFFDSNLAPAASEADDLCRIQVATCALLLENAMRIRDSGIADENQFFDVRYGDLMADPSRTISGIYEHFQIEYSAEAEARMRAYQEAKPKDKHGVHRYSFEDTGFDLETERRRFVAYQERYGVPSEV